MNLIYMVLGVCIDGGAFTSKKKDGGGHIQYSAGRSEQVQNGFKSSKRQ